MSDYPHDEFDKDGKIVCQFCGKSLNIISPTHLRKHELTLNQYKEKYKDIHLTSNKYRTVQKFCHTSMFAPTAKPLTEIMDEVLVTEPIEPKEEESKSRQLTNEALIALNQETPSQVVSKPKVKNSIQNMKNKILDTLKRYFFHIEQNYNIQIFGPSGHLIHEFITDFADPVQKVVVNFPKTFWHNKNSDPAVNTRLNEHGWKVLELYSLAPSNKEIIELVQPYLR